MVGFRRAFTVFLAALFLAGSAAGQTADNLPERVGRVSYLSDTVSWRETPGGAWQPASLNYPVIAGSSFWTEPDALAEIQIGADSIRLDGGTEMDFQQLDDQVLRISVPQGVINLHAETRDPGEVYEVVTPRGTVSLLAPGTYRIDAGTESLPVAVAAFRGSARFVSTDNTATTVVAGETLLVSGSPAAYTIQATAPTEFDDWSLSRDNYEQPRPVANYVSPEMTGYEDLGGYGTWTTVTDYGPVWIPTVVPAGWAPYRFGHWAWIWPWGWTWIDDEPWGFAPFHYGRWFTYHNRWCWWPGERKHRPVFAPALVAFIGGRDFHAEHEHRAVPAVGWVPLGPHEAFRPYFRASSRYERDVNRNAAPDAVAVRPTDFDAARFTNRGHATVVARETFEGGHYVDRATLNVPQQTLDTAPLAASTALPAAPTRAAAAAPAPASTARNVRFENRTGKQVQRELPRVTSQPAAVATPVITQPAAQPMVAQPHRVEQHETTIIRPQNMQSSQTSAPQPRRIERRQVTTTQPTVIERGDGATTPIYGTGATAPVYGENARPQTTREVAVPRPEQRTVLTPSREGWQRTQRRNTSESVQPRGREESRSSVHQERTQPQVREQSRPQVREERVQPQVREESRSSVHQERTQPQVREQSRPQVQEQQTQPSSSHHEESRGNGGGHEDRGNGHNRGEQDQRRQ